jgi:hypothetical protein
LLNKSFRSVFTGIFFGRAAGCQDSQQKHDHEQGNGFFHRFFHIIQYLNYNWLREAIDKSENSTFSVRQPYIIIKITDEGVS